VVSPWPSSSTPLTSVKRLLASALGSSHKICSRLGIPSLLFCSLFEHDRLCMYMYMSDGSWLALVDNKLSLISTLCSLMIVKIEIHLQLTCQDINIRARASGTVVVTFSDRVWSACRLRTGDSSGSAQHVRPRTWSILPPSSSTPPSKNTAELGTNQSSTNPSPFAAVRKDKLEAILQRRPAI
jgi:hypothetical protein